MSAGIQLIQKAGDSPLAFTCPALPALSFAAHRSGPPESATEPGNPPQTPRH